MVSALTQYGRDLPITQWDLSSWPEFVKALEVAKEFDEKTNQPHCEDPEKSAWMQEVEERLQRLESEAWRKQGLSGPNHRIGSVQEYGVL